MATSSPGTGSLLVESAHVYPLDPTPISALFLIYFDIKAGYTIIWKRSMRGLQLEGVVEYKSLPSGLHTVSKDVTYFTHDGHIGVSAFVSAPAAEESRNARMIAVGVLVPQASGRPSHFWEHTAALQDLGQQLVEDTAYTQILEEYWKKHRIRVDDETKPSGLPTSRQGGASSYVKGNDSARSAGTMSQSELLEPAIPLALDVFMEHHPLRSMSSLVNTFGPLLFPIYRAALLRKRILISCNIPIHEICGFVYNISLLSNVGMLSRFAESVPNCTTIPAGLQNLSPMFTIGVHDIPFLERGARRLQENKSAMTLEHQIGVKSAEYEEGYIACTTDAILATKESLYDVLITMPQQPDSPTPRRSWPTMESAKGQSILATQRDLRRYKNLCMGLSSDEEDTAGTDHSEDRFLDDNDESLSAQPPPDTTQPIESNILNQSEINAVVESVTWTALTYDGFSWWTSAAERQMRADEELQLDITLLENDVDNTLFSENTKLGATKAPNHLGSESNVGQEIAIIRYFHRLTLNMFSTISDVVGTAALIYGEDVETLHNSDCFDEDASRCDFSSDAIVKMGLDSWSVNDHAFVKELTKMYFARDAVIQSRNVDICGVRIC